MEYEIGLVDHQIPEILRHAQIRLANVSRHASALLERLRILLPQRVVQLKRFVQLKRIKFASISNRILEHVVDAFVDRHALLPANEDEDLLDLAASQQLFYQHFADKACAAAYEDGCAFKNCRNSVFHPQNYLRSS